MALPDKLRKSLACPKCHSALDYVESDSRLECQKCRLAFRVVNDIPVLVIEEAEELK